MLVKEVRVKSILAKSKVYDYVINPYVGCQHGCTYCYARFMKRFSGHVEPWGEFVDVKINAPELLEKEIRRKKMGEIWISGVCDPYQPVEKKYMLTRKCLEILSNYNWPVFIQTKSPLVTRDIDLLKHFERIDVGFSIGTANDRVREIFEPQAPSIFSRIEALRILRSEKIRTYVMVAPVLPGAEGLVSMLRGLVDYVIIDKMNYHYADWVYRKYGLNRVEDVGYLGDLFRELNVKVEVVS
ncbi:MAG: SPL family radical SAM protein [Candidatus Hydrothermia bacterium]